MPTLFLHFCLFLFITTVTNLIPAVHSNCIEAQQQSLLHFKKNLEFDSCKSSKLITWNSSTECCSWLGVTCSTIGSVVGLDISSESISCSIDNSSSLFQLQHLQSLNLADNNFKSSSIPSAIGKLTELRYLNLSDALFSGVIPIEISRLTRLTTLDLSDNSYPSFAEIQNLSMLIQNLTELTEVYLDSVVLSRQGSDWCEAISSSLPNLRVLSLSGCRLSGPICDSLAKLQSLHEIDLSLNQLDGTIPSSVVSLPRLETLTLSHNRFSGQVPEFSNTSSHLLNTLDLENNNLEGQIPTSIFNLQGLTSLHLSSNNFSGFPFNGPQVPRSLSLVDLSHNSLLFDYNGTNSSFLQIDHLVLASNKLRAFPDFLRNQITLNISDLDLSNNQIQGQIPNWILSLKSLNSLDLSGNSLVTLEAPLRNSTYVLPLVDLHSNQLQGQIPLFLSGDYMDYSRNNFNSGIPIDIGDFISTKSYLSLSSNNFHGAIPKSICNASGVVLDLSNNSLSGNIPQCLTQSHSLLVIDMRRNNLSGTIPDNFLKDCKLRTLDLSNNQIQGQLPKSLVNCSRLEVLNLGNNNITDTFPCFLMSISTLRVLVLRSNKFYGSIGCSKTNGTWPVLQIIDLAHNNFSGDVPGRMSLTWQTMVSKEDDDSPTNLGFSYNLPGRYYRDTITTGYTTGNNLPGSYNRDTITTGYTTGNNLPGRYGGNTNRYCRDTIMTRNNLLGRCIGDNGNPSIGCNHRYARGYSRYVTGPSVYYTNAITTIFKGLELDVVKILTIFTLIDYSANKFNGSIPEEIGELKSLYVLNLSGNAFTGKIPSSFGKMQQLESLDLSKNHLSGQIPPQFANLTFLAFLDLSNNELVGKIPTSTQISTFPNTSFEGNKGLWGPPLTVDAVLPPPISNGNSSPPNSGDEIDWDVICVEIGFTCGFGIAIGSLLFCKRWRKWYYRAMRGILFKIFPQLEQRFGNHRRHVFINTRR